MSKTIKHVKRHPQTASQAVVLLLTLVAVKVFGKDITDNYAWVAPIIAPIIVAKINERWTVPWGAVLAAVKAMKVQGGSAGRRTQEALAAQGVKRVL